MYHFNLPCTPGPVGGNNAGRGVRPTACPQPVDGIVPSNVPLYSLPSGAEELAPQLRGLRYCAIDENNSGFAKGRIVMIMRLESRRCLLLAATIGTLTVAASPAMGQQPPASTEAPPPWAQGRPEAAVRANLAPIAPPPLATEVDKLPIAKLKAPKGSKVELYASGLANARSLRQGDKGTVFVSTRILDKVYAITDQGGKREVKTLYSRLYRPNGLVFDHGTLYIAELSKISKAEKIEDNLDNPPKLVVIYDDLPKDEAHGWKFLAIGPDNKLYFNVGAPCNICMPSPAHAQLRRINLDGSNPEVVARGIRQVVGMDWHPVLRQLYFTENSRDWLSEDIPEDKLNRLTQPGKDNFGYPYCHQGNIPDQEFGWGRSCDEFTKPVALLGPHSAPLGMRFYTGNMFPPEYRNAILVARHGSWNRSKKFGGDIAVVSLNENGTVKSVDPFITGFIENNNYLGRPADVLVLKDGSLLISDDFNGAVYRVSYDAASAGR
jgi:glucose/arabinose dehydrogenase